MSNTEHRVLVAVEGHGYAMRCQIQIKRFEITEGAYLLDEPQLHQRTGGIVDEDE